MRWSGVRVQMYACPCSHVPASVKANFIPRNSHFCCFCSHPRFAMCSPCVTAGGLLALWVVKKDCTKRWVSCQRSAFSAQLVCPSDAALIGTVEGISKESCTSSVYEVASVRRSQLYLLPSLYYADLPPTNTSIMG